MTLLEQLLPIAPLAFLQGIPNWVLAAAPLFAAILTWHAASMRNKADKEASDREWTLKLETQRRQWEEQDKQRLLLERQAIHAENADQTRAWTERFEAMMDGYDARVEDLTKEVTDLRKEVISLRRIIDWQRNACAGCPKFQQLLIENHNAPKPSL